MVALNWKLYWLAIVTLLSGLVEIAPASAQITTSVTVGSNPVTVTPDSNSTSSGEVPFTGEVPTACSFDVIDPGRLVPVGVDIFPTLTSLEPGGLAGQVNVRCNFDSQLVVNKPIQIGGPTLVDLSNADAFVRSSVGNTSVNSTPLGIPAGLLLPLDVDMTATASDLSLGFPPGTYTYKVTLTVAP